MGEVQSSSTCRETMMGVDSVERQHAPLRSAEYILYGVNVITLTQEYPQGEKAQEGQFALKAVSRIQLPFVVEMCSI